MRNRLSSSLIVVAAALGPGVAVAAPPVSQAQALFDQGILDMEAGQFEKACPAIEASQRMEPMAGTLFTLAECEAQRGRVATAIRYYGEYLALYRSFAMKKKLEQKHRADTSEAQLQKLGPLAPRLTLSLPPGSGADVVVKRNGEVVADLSLGTAILVNPGDHVITTQVPGGPVVEHRISLSPGDAKSLDLSVRRDAATDSKPTPAPVEAGAAPPPAPSAPLDARPFRIGMWSAGAVSVAGLVVGVVTGILAIQQRDLVRDICEPTGECDAAGFQAAERLRAFGTASTIGFVTAGFGLAVGVTLLVATPSAPTPSPGVGNAQVTGVPLAPFGMLVTGSF
jgi:hypothetical protein